AFSAWRCLGVGTGVLGGQSIDGGVPAVGFWQPEYLHGAGFAHFAFYADGDGGHRSDFWVSAGAAVHAARRGANAEGSGRRSRRRRARAAAECVGGHAGGAIAVAADWRGTVFAEPEESEQPGPGIFGGAPRGLQH